MRNIVTALMVTALMLSPLAGCSGAPRTLYGKTIDGQVVDAQTGKPIAGAHVMYLWEATVIPTSFTGHNPPNICYHAAATVADSQGHFHIDSWEAPQKYNVPNRVPTGWAYAVGYVPIDVSPPYSLESAAIPQRNVIRLSMSAAGGAERLTELWDVIRRTCFHGGSSQRNIYPLARAAYDEAKRVARGREQNEEVRGFARLVARAWIAPDPVGESVEAEVDQFIGDHLK